MMRTAETTLLTPTQLAVELQLGKTKTYELLARGVIPSLRLSSKVIRIRRDDLNLWLERQAEYNEAAAGSIPAAALEARASGHRRPA